MSLVVEGRETDIDLGPGTSPSWASPSGAGDGLLYFRRPAESGLRDEVIVATPPEWRVQTVLDFEGEPVYPPELSLYPPPVDLLESGSRLVTLFYRRVRQNSEKTVDRWKVLFTSNGKILNKQRESITK